MDKGGYKIVDLKDINITTTTQVIKNIYDEIRTSYRKVILLSGLTINNVKFNDIFVKAVPVGSDYLINVYQAVVDNEMTQYNIFIEDNDNVTLQTNILKGAETLPNEQEYYTVKEGE